MQDGAFPSVRLGVPGLDGVAIPDLAAAAWADVVRWSVSRSGRRHSSSPLLMS
jgi:hypothetical protein